MLSRRTSRPPSRRDLLRAGLVAGAGVALPTWVIDEAMAADEAAKPAAAATDRPRVLLVGCGGRGMALSKEAKPFCDVVAVCDVDAKHLANAADDYKSAKPYADFRKALDHPGVDAVLNATPDHWHTLVNIAAMRRGKDVYSEKPLTLTVDEGKHLLAVQKQTGRIIQVGSQQRSDAKFRLACEVVRNGRLGKIQRVDVALPGGRSDVASPETAPPPELDWDFWQGQAPVRKYRKERAHVWFRFWLDYSGGTLTDWGAHHNDIALWALGETAPVKVEGKTLVQNAPDSFTTPAEYLVTLTYPSGVTHTIRSLGDYQWNGSKKTVGGKPLPPAIKPAKGPPQDLIGVTFYGTDGWLFVTRGRIEASDPDLLKAEFPASATRLYVSADHRGNFFDCVKTRKDPICPAAVGHRSVSVGHLSVIACRLGRSLAWDPEAEHFTGDGADEGNALLAREMRKPWSYDTV
jgi:predicted dehydrogenase